MAGESECEFRIEHESGIVKVVFSMLYMGLLNTDAIKDDPLTFVSIEHCVGT